MILTVAAYGHSCDLWLYTASGGEWLEFDTERDALWARRVWEGFLEKQGGLMALEQDEIQGKTKAEVRAERKRHKRAKHKNARVRRKKKASS